MQSFIFDFNGTLFLDAEIHRAAWKRFMAERGRSITDEDFDRYMYGPTNTVIFRHFFPGISDDEIVRLAGEKEAVYRRIVLDDPALKPLAPGAPEMLDMLAERGIPCAIATASIRANVDFYLNDLGLDRWFDIGRIFYDTGDIPGKPDPAIYRLAMDQMGFRPEETTIVEDSLTGIQSACGAGAGRIIAIDTTVGPDALLRMPEVDEVIHDFHGFERFVQA